MLTAVFSKLSVFLPNQQMKSEVKYIRGNFSLKLWTYTQDLDFLMKENWTNHASEQLADFEKNILEAMKTGGWDGVENPERLQWTRMGALFYSIIVITTIGKEISIFCFIKHILLVI